KRLPWSVMATAGIFCSATTSMSWVISQAPSRREESVWQWRWTKGLSDIRKVGLTFWGRGADSILDWLGLGCAREGGEGRGELADVLPGGVSWGGFDWFVFVVLLLHPARQRIKPVAPLESTGRPGRRGAIFICEG